MHRLLLFLWINLLLPSCYFRLVKVKSSQVKCICMAHFMYKTIQSALHKIKALQWGMESRVLNITRAPCPTKYIYTGKIRLPTSLSVCVSLTLRNFTFTNQAGLTGLHVFQKSSFSQTKRILFFQTSCKPTE